MELQIIGNKTLDSSQPSNAEAMFLANSTLQDVMFVVDKW